MEQSEFEITVVIPVYNRAGIVGRTLETLDAQVFQDFYVILVDNNSTDGTLEVLQQWAGKHPGRATVLMQPTPGAAAARQMGLDAVATPWTIFFDSDDEMSAMHLANIVKTIDLHPDADIIGWETRMIRNGKIYRKGAFTTRDMQFRSLFNGIMATLRYCARTELFRA
ncbi:MAG: glycosyltransferase family 2 protein, partial [Muribaculaceae bacterium]|nr:glycosyltransferase family 2 protein [Muribaculaceae bacterium]